MLRHSRYLVACCGAAFGLASFIIGLEVSSTTAASSVERSPAGINRMLKGDRLPLVQDISRNAINNPIEIKAPRAPTPRPELLDGCEPIMSTIGQPPLSRVAGRCLS
jgi:hypothetical protein